MLAGETGDVFLAGNRGGTPPAKAAAFHRDPSQCWILTSWSRAERRPTEFVRRRPISTWRQVRRKGELTGQVPMNDEQFSVIRNSALRDTLTAMFGVLIVLWLALRSWKIIAAVLFSLIVGLAITAALGLAMVGAFNLISIAFFVLFVGLGVDFGIQFSVRYRAERHDSPICARRCEAPATQGGQPARAGGGGHRGGILRRSCRPNIAAFPNSG